ncbi:hypothetical protein KEM52_000685, partial [Ascosphaera acerosa]
ATPKFGTFICLNCAGIHRGLGVHISFVRSITMDGFKVHETARMEQSGGNKAWKAFFDAHELNQQDGRTFDASTIPERYSGLVGEEWKDRLSAKVEGREYVPLTKEEMQKRKVAAAAAVVSTASSRTATPQHVPAASAGGKLSSESPARSRAQQQLAADGGSALGVDPKTRKQANEEYFARMGAQNSERPEGVAPSQGGKYTGFGGGMPVETARNNSSQSAGLPGLDQLQQDPMAALSKGFGWFTSTIGKSAKQVHEGYIQPAAKTIATSDFAAQARLAAQQGLQGIQTGARGAATQFNRFVEGVADDGRAFSPSASRPNLEQSQLRADSAAHASNDTLPLPSDDPFGSNGTTVAEARSPVPTSGRRVNASAGQSAASAAATPLSSKSKTGAGTGAGAKARDKDEDWDDNWTGATGFVGGDLLYALAQTHPDWEVTALVRSEEKAALVKKQYPSVRTVQGDLDSSDLIEEETKNADIVYHTADCDHEAAAQAIAKGLGQHPADRPGYWIHTSGAANITYRTVQANLYGQAPEPSDKFDDWENVGALTSLPADALHRSVDMIVLAAGAGSGPVKTAIVAPPLIYGQGRGPGSSRSIQTPNLAKAILERGKGFQVGAGDSTWNYVHLYDLTDLYLQLGEAAVANAAGGQVKDGMWGEKGYYFAESGTVRFGDLSAEVTKVAHDLGLIESSEVESLSVEAAREISRFSPLMWASNSVGKSVRARELLGWAPSRPGLLDRGVLTEVVEYEAAALKA